MGSEMCIRDSPDFSHAPISVASVTQPGDVVITMGAGTVTMLADPILERLAGADASVDGGEVDE